MSLGLCQAIQQLFSYRIGRLGVVLVKARFGRSRRRGCRRDDRIGGGKATNTRVNACEILV